MSVKVTLALEVTYKPGTELWEDLKLVLSDSQAEWKIRPPHANDHKHDQHPYTKTHKESNLQVVTALLAHKLGQGNQCDFLASVRYKLNLGRAFNRNLVRLFGYNGFCAIFRQKTFKKAEIDPEVLPSENVTVKIRSIAEEKYQDLSDDALEIIWQKIDPIEGVFNSLTLVGPADAPCVVDPARAPSPIINTTVDNAVVAYDATPLVADAEPLRCTSSAENSQDALQTNAKMSFGLNPSVALDRATSLAGTPSQDSVASVSSHPLRNSFWTNRITATTTGIGTLVILLLASISLPSPWSLLRSQTTNDPSPEPVAAVPRKQLPPTESVAMEQMDFYDSTMLLSDRAFEGFRAAEDVLNTPLAAQAPWLKGLPAKHRIELAHRYAAAVRIAGAKPRLLPESMRPRAIRCEYKYDALIAVIVSGSFTEGAGHSPSHYFHAIIDTRRPPSDVPLILREPKDEIEGTHFNIAAIVFHFDLLTPADAFLAIELLP